MTLGMKTHLYGMSPTYLMQYGNQKAPGLFLWSIIHLRYVSQSVRCFILIWISVFDIHVFLFSKLSTCSCVRQFQALKHNGSLFAHVFFARSGFPVDPNDPEYQPLAAFALKHRNTLCLINSNSNCFFKLKAALSSLQIVFYFIYLKKLISSAAVVTYLPKAKANKKKSLLGNSKGTNEDEAVSEVCDPQFDPREFDWFYYWVYIETSQLL